MRNSSQALKHDMEEEVLTPHTLKLVPKQQSNEKRNNYEVTHNFLSDFGVETERKGFFDDLGDFLA